MPWRVERARDVRPALAIDAAHRQVPREDALTAAAARGDLWLAGDGTTARGLLCRDDACFFARPFVGLVVVDPGFRRQGLASALFTAVETATTAPLWTSTNRSNAPMIALLRGRGYDVKGEIEGLDEGDPELFFRRDKPHP